PRSIENGKIQAPVQDDLLAAGTRRLERSPGIVQPNINALHEMTPDVDVVVFYKDEFVGKLWVAHQLSNLLEHPLARFVARVRLAGEHELNRALRVVHHGGQLLDVCQN